MYLIKKYEERYNDKVNKFIVSIFVEEFGFEQYRGNLAKEDNGKYNRNGNNLWIAIDEEDNVIGTIALVKYEEKEMELKKFYLKEEYRGTGLSKELYKKVVNYSKKREIEKIILGTYHKMETAIHFYIRRGFEEEIERRREDGARFFSLSLENR